ncbi:Fizzy- protein [Branchiostoma belcheri]|nr:Fizzy- protein [Branchiostoma belcheri]
MTKKRYEIAIWRADITGTSSNRDVYYLSNKSDNSDLPAGNYEITFNAEYTGTDPVLTAIYFKGQLVYGDGGTPAIAAPATAATPTITPAEVASAPATAATPTITPAEVASAPATAATQPSHLLKLQLYLQQLLPRPSHLLKLQLHRQHVMPLCRHKLPSEDLSDNRRLMKVFVNREKTQTVVTVLCEQTVRAMVVCPECVLTDRCDALRQSAQQHGVLRKATPSSITSSV